MTPFIIYCICVSVCILLAWLYVRKNKIVLNDARGHRLAVIYVIAIGVIIALSAFLWHELANFVGGLVIMLSLIAFNRDMGMVGISIAFVSGVASVLLGIGVLFLARDDGDVVNEPVERQTEFVIGADNGSGYPIESDTIVVTLPEMERAIILDDIITHPEKYSQREIDAAERIRELTDSIIASESIDGFNEHTGLK